MCMVQMRCKTNMTQKNKIEFNPETESQDQYIYRIASMKESNNWTWKNIADILNNALGNEYDESAYRKKVQSFNKLLKACEKQVFSDDEYLKKIQEERDELYKAKKQFQDQRREYNKILSQNARSEHLESELIKAAERLSEVKLLCSGYPLDVSENDALIVFTDWHYGMVTDNIWNEYNTDICVSRVNTLCSKAKEYLKLHKVKNLHVLLLGDFVHGGIHNSARVASEELVCEQLMNVSELLAEAIQALSTSVCSVYVYSTFGNHARTIQNKHDSIHNDNMERIIPWWLMYRLSANNKIEIVDNDLYEFIYLNVCGHDIVATHGDLENFKKFGLDMHTLFSRKYGLDVEYVFSGDKHHFETIDPYGIDNAIVSSLCGTDEYANNKRLYSKAGQTLCIFNEEDGKVCT